MNESERKLLASAEKQMLQFAEGKFAGDRMIFGRLEGIQEAIDRLGSPELMKAHKALVLKHFDAMAKRCES